MLRILGIPISDDDARHLIATLIVEGTPDARTAAAQLTKGVECDLYAVGLSRAERTAVLAWCIIGFGVAYVVLYWRIVRFRSPRLLRMMVTRPPPVERR